MKTNTFFYVGPKWSKYKAFGKFPLVKPVDCIYCTIAVTVKGKLSSYNLLLESVGELIPKGMLPDVFQAESITTLLQS